MTTLESLKTRLMEYYKKTSPLIGYYYAKGQLRSVNGLGEMLNDMEFIERGIEEKELLVVPGNIFSSSHSSIVPAARDEQPDH